MAKKAQTQTSEPIQVVGPSPRTTDPNWTEFVLNHLREDEKVDNKYPKFHGLMRVAEQLGFQILDLNIQIVQTPEPANNMRATAVARVHYSIGENDYGIPIGNYFQSDAADCSAVNTKRPYCNHPVATASTTAQARAMRKVLRLATHAAEEIMNSPEGVEAEMAQELEDRSRGVTTGQRNLLTSVSKRLNIDLCRLIMEHLKLGNPDNLTGEQLLDKLTETDAQNLIRLLNRYQKSPGDKDAIAIPETILIGAKD